MCWKKRSPVGTAEFGRGLLGIRIPCHLTFADVGWTGVVHGRVFLCESESWLVEKLQSSLAGLGGLFGRFPALERAG